LGDRTAATCGRGDEAIGRLFCLRWGAVARRKKLGSPNAVRIWVDRPGQWLELKAEVNR
jgi:hypothetical protein